MKRSHHLFFSIWLSTLLLEISCFTYHPLSSSRKSKSCVLSNTSTDPIKEEEEESDDPNYLYYRPQARAAPQGGAFAYTEPNIRRSAETFKMIREIGGVECTNDVYVRSPSRFEYWFIGKLARTDGTVGLREAVAKCWNIMEEHAVRLRPVELGREFGNLEIWLANGDTELEMSQAVAGSDGGYGLDGLKQMDAMNLKKMEKNVEGTENVKIKEIGFMCEYVTNTGQGFFIVRDDQGRVMQ